MSDLNLGEDQGSIGFDSHAKLAYNKKFMEYGSTFRRGDTIGCFLDLTDPKLITVAYTRNGKQQLTDDGAETVTYNREELGCAEQRYYDDVAENYMIFKCVLSPFPDQELLCTHAFWPQKLDI